MLLVCSLRAHSRYKYHHKPRAVTFVIFVAAQSLAVSKEVRGIIGADRGGASDRIASKLESELNTLFVSDATLLC